MEHPMQISRMLGRIREATAYLLRLVPGLLHGCSLEEDGTEVKQYQLAGVHEFYELRLSRVIRGEPWGQRRQAVTKMLQCESEMLLR
jgi:hypothetical protein